MKRRLNIGIGLLHRPRLLLLDEPTVGVDPQSRNAILERRGARAAGHGDPVHDALHGGGRAPLRPGRDHRRRADPGRGHAPELVSLIGERDRVELAPPGDLRGSRRGAQTSTASTRPAATRAGSSCWWTTRAAPAAPPRGGGRRRRDRQQRRDRGARPRGGVPPPDRPRAPRLTDADARRPPHRGEGPRQRVRDRSALIVALSLRSAWPPSSACCWAAATRRSTFGTRTSTWTAPRSRKACAAARWPGSRGWALPTISQVDEGTDAARAAIEAGEVDAALIVPDGFGAAVQSGSGSDLTGRRQHRFRAGRGHPALRRRELRP